MTISERKVFKLHEWELKKVLGVRKKDRIVKAETTNLASGAMSWLLVYVDTPERAGKLR